jgi:hypothetical protein
MPDFSGLRMISWFKLFSGAYAFRPLFVFSSTVVLFYLAIQRRADAARVILSVLHLAGVVVALGLRSISLVPCSQLLIPSGLIITLHTTSVLFWERKVVKLPGDAPFAHRLRAVFRVWANPRRLRLSDTDSPKPDTAVRVRFALLRCGHAAALLVVRHLLTVFTTNALRGLQLSRRDFGPDKQGILPPLTERDLCLRALMSSRWIWDTCLLLTVTHDLLAAVFVSVLQWDRPHEWPPLFGSITEAYSLRRFWGVFWHRLHVAVFDAYLRILLRVQVRSPVSAAPLFILFFFSSSGTSRLTTGCVATPSS